MPDFSLGLLTIATNGYTKYLPDLIQSASENLRDFQKYRHYIFTDDLTYLLGLMKGFPSVDFKAVEVPNYGWPDASLLRYEIYRANRHLFTDDILMHLDSDMYFMSMLEFEISPKYWAGGMAFVEHPGFFKPKILDFRRRAIESRIRSLLIGGYGAWETSKGSTAFTPRGSRKKYLCGGAWFGYREQFLDFCETARSRVEIDRNNGVVAKWHDESHLNCLVSTESMPTIFSSRYCYDPKYGKVLNNPILLAVDKSVSLKDQLRAINGKSNA
jgi:histo-blood group ABO system transferase